MSERPRLYIPCDGGRVNNSRGCVYDQANAMTDTSNTLMTASEPEAVERSEPAAEAAQQALCPRCGSIAADDETTNDFRVCGACGYHYRESARAAIIRLIDPGSFREQDSGLASTDPLHFVDETAYRERLLALKAETGEADALVSGFARLQGHEVAIAALDFGFLGGSMGVVVGEKLVRIAERARERRVPLISISASGGARMQEGMLSLLQMAKTSAAVQRLRESGCAYISILAHPTTGGVFASFANLGDIILAEPGALIGFAGPRVAEQIIGRKLPEGSHTAEFLYAHGMVDAIIDRREQRDFLARCLAILSAPRTGYQRRGHSFRSPRNGPEVPAWDAVQRARGARRLTSVDYVERMLGEFVELHGDRSSGDDPAIVAGIGTLDDKAIAIIALERGHLEDRERRHDGRPYPEGYRKARRVMELAERLHLPLITLIDTPGAYPGVESEARGLASELAGSLARMSTLRTPIVSAVIGEGGSGGALALAVADRVLMLDGAIYSVIAPEGAAAILYRDATRAPEISSKLKLTARELKRLNVVDEIVREPDTGTGSDPDAAAAVLGESIMNALADLQRKRIDRVVRERYDRYQSIGRRHAKRPRRRLSFPRRRHPMGKAG
ncbi:MAG: acetyl-CoA carboxylase, carboxyl transferase, beta subunit [Thermomicrobiales bacterium]|nr:acetyl-CoA carboxylase, carboxyl transferase, beta subunit [Thermomicrobiales bacterium]